MRTTAYTADVNIELFSTVIVQITMKVCWSHKHKLLCYRLTNTVLGFRLRVWSVVAVLRGCTCESSHWNAPPTTYNYYYWCQTALSQGLDAVGIGQDWRGKRAVRGQSPLHHHQLTSPSPRPMPAAAVVQRRSFGARRNQLLSRCIDLRLMELSEIENAV